MPDLATRLVQDNFPGYPNAGAVPPGSRVEFTLSQPVFNASNNKDENMVVVAPINPITGDMGFPDPNDATRVGARLFCNDDPNCKPQGSFWRVHYVIPGPGPTRPDLAIVVSTGNTDPVNLGTLAQPVGGTVAYGIRVKEVDGAPDIPNVMTLIVSNGSLTDNGGQTATLVTGGGGGGGGSGTVTSVGMTGDGTVFNATVPGSPVTTSGSFAPTLHTQAANAVFAGPTTGSPAASAFRALVAADVPAATTSAQGAAILATPSSDVTAGHVVQASDARLSDARAPTAHASSHISTGGDAIPAAVPAGASGLLTGANATKLGQFAPVAAKVLTVNNSLTLAGTDGDTATVPAGGGTLVVTTDARLAIYDAMAFAGGKPAAGANLLYNRMARAITVAAALAGSQGVAATAATASAVCTVNKIVGGTPTALGTLTFAAAGTVATLAGAGGSLAIGDILQILAPASQDATLADVGITLKVSTP